MYNKIIKLQPHFFSLREIDGMFCLDLKFPSSWRVHDIVEKYESVALKVQDKNETNILITIVGDLTVDGFESMFSCANQIIKENMEMEEKNKLLEISIAEIKSVFEEKIKEVTTLFTEKNLDELKKIKIGYENTKNNPKNRMVAKGNKEGRKRNRTEQIDDDKGDKVD
jgi:hypothetical protein